MSRIIAGRFGGRRLRTPEGRDTRPTSDRVREGLFNSINSRVDLDGARFADLYAGSGAVGLEALSRGASHVLLVERDPKAARVAGGNIRILTDSGAASRPARRAAVPENAPGRVELVVDRVERVLATTPSEPYDVVFADPPYALTETEVTTMLTALAGNEWLAKAALVVVERSTRSAELEWVPRITADGVRRYGETTLWYGRRS
jgi:16S rRNA (guanine(966)-N(2))-methyltransferase RsmD